MADGDLNHLVTLVQLAHVRPSDMIANQVRRSASDFPASVNGGVSRQTDRNPRQRGAHSQSISNTKISWMPM
jgi:hypothetical protein